MLAIFTRYDKDKSGALDLFEFQRVCDDCGVGLVGHRIFRALDKDGGGEISYREINKAIEQRDREVPKESKQRARHRSPAQPAAYGRCFA